MKSVKEQMFDAFVEGLNTQDGEVYEITVPAKLVDWIEENLSNYANEVCGVSISSFEHVSFLSVFCFISDVVCSKLGEMGYGDMIERMGVEQFLQTPKGQALIPIPNS